MEKDKYQKERLEKSYQKLRQTSKSNSEYILKLAALDIDVV